jgi:hypothetical protein
MAKSKDSAEVVEFLTLLARLKDCCDDDPECLSELAKEDDVVKDLCVQLSRTAFLLRMNERRHRQLFAAPADPKFLGAWRDFEDRFDKPVGEIELDDLFPGPSGKEPGHTDEADLRWKYADHDSIEQARAIEAAIEYTCETTRSDDSLDEDFYEIIEDAMAAWERLKHNAGLDLAAVRPVMVAPLGALPTAPSLRLRRRPIVSRARTTASRSKPSAASSR